MLQIRHDSFYPGQYSRFMVDSIWNPSAPKFIMACHGRPPVYPFCSHWHAGIHGSSSPHFFYSRRFSEICRIISHHHVIIGFNTKSWSLHDDKNGKLRHGMPRRSTRAAPWLRTKDHPRTLASGLPPRHHAVQSLKRQTFTGWWFQVGMMVGTKRGLK